MFEYNQEERNNRNNKDKHGLSPILIKTINKIIQTEGYITYSMYVKDVSTEGGNYLSSLKEVDIKGKTVNNDKETNLFIKQCLPDSDKNIMPSEKLFLNEIFIYTEFAKLFTEIQNEFKIPDEEKYKFVKCYNGDIDSNCNSLIFDNMINKGFKVCDRFNVMPLKAMELSVKQLAKFHSFSMVLKQYKPDFYTNKIQKMKHCFLDNDDGENFVTSMCNISSQCLEGDRKIKLEKYLPGLFKKLERYLLKNEKAKFLCHGDYRMNNILVKEMNGQAATVIAIDYQIVYLGSPVIDLIFMIFMSTDRQFRKDHMDHLKEIYFESFTKFLKYFDIDVDSVYPKNEFDVDFVSQIDFGLVTTLILLPLGLASDEDVPELNNELKTMKLHYNFKPRMEGIIDDFIEWGYL